MGATEGAPVDSSTSSLPGQLTLRELVEASVTLGKDGFQKRWPCPFLLQLNRVDATNTYQKTSAFKTMFPEGTPIPTRALPEHAFPVAKRPGANAFGLMVTLGRASNNDMVVPDGAVSKFHASFMKSPAGVWSITDSSSGGTWFDGVRLERAKAKDLYSGARLSLATAVLFRFVTTEEMFVYLGEARARLTRPS